MRISRLQGNRSKTVTILKFVIVVHAFLGNVASAALSTDTTSIPNDYVLPNYDRIPLGQTEALEGGAFVARAEESLATWYNPAGVSRNETSLINASSAVFEWTKVTVDGLGSNGTSTTQNTLPAFFGGVVGNPPLHTDRLRFGFAIARPTVWSFTLDDALDMPAAGGTERLNYTSIASFSETNIAMAISYATERHFHYGVSFGVDLTSLSQNLTVSDQLTTNSSSQNYLRTLRISGTAVNFIATFGTQYDFTDHIRIGAIVKTPGISLGGSTELTYESLATSAGQTTDLYIHDENAQFRYVKPLEANVGIAYLFKRAAIEVDLKFHANTDVYQLYGSSQPVSEVTTNGAGTPTSSTQSFSPVNYRARSVVNAALGGHAMLGPYLDAHAGVFTINSPVMDQTGTPFKSVDVYGATFGLSVRSTHLSGSLGLGYEFGTSDTFTAADLLGGQAVSSKMSISSVSLLYALSYTF